MSDAQSHLTKYCTADAAKSALQNSALRWSSPHLFADPFEASYKTQLSFSRETLLPTAIKYASGMIFSRENPKGDTPLVNAIRRWRGEERFQTPEEAESVLRELLEKMVDARFEVIDKIMNVWLNYNKKLRICSFCSKLDNLLAWHNFADKHRGVAIRFNVEEDGCFKKPEPMSYAATHPEITGMKEQIAAIIYNQKDKSIERFPALFSIKSQQNKAEQEWRCFRESPNNKIAEDPDSWYDDIAFESNEIHSMVLGLNISEKDENEILQCAKEKFSKMKVFRAQAAKGKYAIELERL